MTNPADPTDALRRAAAEFAAVDRGTACNQSSFKAGGRAFLFVGPGTKGVGFKAMFKLERSLESAAALAEKEPSRFEVGKTGWLTARFSAEEPLPKSLWSKWLAESYAIAAGATGKAGAAAAKKGAAKKGTARRSDRK